MSHRSRAFRWIRARSPWNRLRLSRPKCELCCRLPAIVWTRPMLRRPISSHHLLLSARLKLHCTSWLYLGMIWAMKSNESSNVCVQLFFVQFEGRDTVRSFFKAIATMPWCADISAYKSSRQSWWHISSSALFDSESRHTSADLIVRERTHWSYFGQFINRLSIHNSVLLDVLRLTRSFPFVLLQQLLLELLLLVY